MSSPERVADATARRSYGRLVAFLAARSGDIASAEDALADAFATALETWGRDGVPVKPEAWLMAVARRRMIDRHRQSARARAAVDDLLILAAPNQDASTNEDEIEANIPDERLKLMFVCAHPAIDAGIRTPLMLQTVLGIEAHHIASAFVMSPASMSQRLVRAKRRIREAGIVFAVPEAPELADRLEPVLEAIYGAFGTGWDAIAGNDDETKSLSDEAVSLARVLVEVMPDEAEPKGLLALMLYATARAAARRDKDGRFVPLSEQDAALWDRALMVEAENWLGQAARLAQPGRFQLEAAIQSAYVSRAWGFAAEPAVIVGLHRRLADMRPTLGAVVGYAAALGEAGLVAQGIDALRRLEDGEVVSFQPYWAVAAHLERLAGHLDKSLAAYDRAIGLSTEPSVRRFLMAKRAAVIPV